MNVVRKDVRGCCGQNVIVLRLENCLTTNIKSTILAHLTTLNELSSFKDTGIMYLHNKEMIISGSYGSKSIQVKVKKDSQLIDQLIDLLNKI